MSDSPENRPLSKETRTSLLDTGWSDTTPASEGESTVQISRDELQKLVTVDPAPDEPPRELPRYEAILDDSAPDNEPAHSDDATKRISYAALLGGAQAGRGGPRLAPDLHDLPTLVAYKPLTEEMARALAAGVPIEASLLAEEVDEEDIQEVEAEEPLPSFAPDSELSFDAFELASQAYAAPFAAGAAAPVPAPRRKLTSNPLPSLGFDDSDVTVRAVIEISEEARRRPLESPPRSEPRVRLEPADELPRASFGAPLREPAPAPSLGGAAVAATGFVAADPNAMPALPPARQSSIPPRMPAEVGSAWAGVFGPLDTPPTLGLLTALGQSCSFLGIRMPLGVLWLVPTALALGALVVLLVETRATAPALAPAPVAVPAPKVPEPSQAPSLHERVARGDQEAFDALSRVPEPERSASDAVALAKGRAALELGHLQELERQIKAGKTPAHDEVVREKLLGFVTDARTAPEALAVVSALPGEEGPDLLYEIWTSTKRTNDTTQLARELVYNPEIRKRASDALNVALDLRAEPACEKIPEILPRAAEHGDHRSLHLLGKLLVGKGCGVENRDDCYPCLRKPRTEDSIFATIKAVRRRPRPKQ